MSTPDQMLRERYGAARGGRRVALLAAVSLVAVAFLAWVAWAAWVHSTPQVDSELVGTEIVDDHTATARVDVHVDDGVEATCLVQALAADHSPVGDRSWTPTQGRNDVEIRTERRASAVKLVGCTTPDQKAPR